MTSSSLFDTLITANGVDNGIYISFRKLVFEVGKLNSHFFFQWMFCSAL